MEMHCGIEHAVKHKLEVDQDLSAKTRGAAVDRTDAVRLCRSPTEWPDVEGQHLNLAELGGRVGSTTAML